MMNVEKMEKKTKNMRIIETIAANEEQNQTENDKTHASLCTPYLFYYFIYYYLKYSVLVNYLVTRLTTIIIVKAKNINHLNVAFVFLYYLLSNLAPELSHRCKTREYEFKVWL